MQPVLQESATEAYSGTEYPAEAALSSDELSVLESAVAAFALTHDSLTPQSRVDQETTDPQIRALPPRPAPDGDVADVAAPTATAVRSYDDDLGRPSASGESTPAGRPVRPTGAAPDGASPVERLSNPDPGIDTSQVVPSVPMMVRAEPLVTPPPLQIDPVLPAPPRFAAVEVNDETREIDLDADDATEGLDHEAVLADVTRRVTIDEHGAPVPSAPPAPAGFVDVAPGDQTQQVRRYSDVVDSDPEPTQAEPFDAPERKP